MNEGNPGHPGLWQDGKWTIRCRRCKAGTGSAYRDDDGIITCRSCGRKRSFGFPRTPCGWVKRFPRLIRRIAVCQRKQGASLKEVSACFGVRHSTIWNWQNSEKVKPPRPKPAMAYPDDVRRRVVAHVRDGVTLEGAARAEGISATRATVSKWVKMIK